MEPTRSSAADPAPGPGAPPSRSPQADERPAAIPGLVGPETHPSRYGFRPGDSHLIVNDKIEQLTAFAFTGQRLFRIPALARGHGGEREWRRRHSDTPPGLYRSSRIYRDWEADPSPPYDRTLAAYGWFSIDLDDLEGQEVRSGRSGIMAHGGGSALGWPDAWSPRQRLLPTLGCIRLHNEDLLRLVLPLHEKGRVFWSVYQEA